MNLRAESVLAGAAAAVGLTGIASALTPELANRVDAVAGVLPPGWPAAARVATLAFGLALVWLSRSLASRRRHAWQLAVALVLGIALAHLAKGLDVEEAASALILLAALVRYRRRFDVPGDSEALRPLLATALALAATGGLAVWLEVDAGPDRIADMLGAASLVVAFRAIHLWLRPLSARVSQTIDERRTAQQLVQAYGRDSLSFFTLRRDKSYLFSAGRRAFLAYRVVGGTLLVSGDPVGDEDEVDSLLAGVCRLSRASGWRLAVLGASAAELDRYRRVGLRAIKLGDEAVLRPERFTLEGRAMRKVRQSVARLDRAGYRFHAATPTEADPRLRSELEEVSRLWRGAQPERGFSMAHDDLYAADTLIAVAEDAEGRVGGFLHLVPTPASGGYSLSAMRRRPGTPNGLMEFLIVRTLEWARTGDVRELSLNFCAFTNLLQPSSGVGRRATRRMLLCLDRLFQLERLYSFNRKFFPEWRPRYLCVERLADLPLVGLAYLHVESLLVPPGPWASRSGSHLAVRPRVGPNANR